jgi:hypothetical protein
VERLLALIACDDNIELQRLKGGCFMATNNSNTNEVVTSASNASDSSNRYQKPTLTKLGSFVELTQAVAGSMQADGGPLMMLSPI